MIWIMQRHFSKSWKRESDLKVSSCILYTAMHKNRDSSHGVSAKVCIRILWKHKFATDMDIPCRLLIKIEEKE